MIPFCHVILLLRGEMREGATGFRHPAPSRPKMVQTHHFQICIQEYFNRGKDNLFPDLYGCPNPLCCYEGRLRRHGFYSRNVLSLMGTYIIFIQRYYCPYCKRTTSLLPSFLVSRFQYSISCIIFAFFQLTVCRVSFAAIAKKINLNSRRSEMSYQHISFYRKRLLQNRPMITGYLGARGVVWAEQEPALWLKDFVCTVCRQITVNEFNLQHFYFQGRHFMSKP